MTATANCPTMDTSFRLLGWESTGVSDQARHIESLLDDYYGHYLEPRLGLLLQEIDSILARQEQVRDSSEETAVELDTIQAAERFARLLPRFEALPEVSVDPDGEISFDWLGPSGKMFSVSVNKHHRLAYAGWFGEKSRVHGTEQLAEGCPQEIVRGIEKATR